MAPWLRITTAMALAALMVVTAGMSQPDRDQAQPSVRVSQWAPLVLVGAQFRPFERVVIRVSSDAETTVRRLRTTRRGTFVARFTTTALDRCSGFSIQVTGVGGRVAKARLPLPLCPPGSP